MSQPFIGNVNLFEAFESFLAQWTAKTETQPTVEYMEFSGDAKDVMSLGDKVCLRMYRVGFGDDNGAPQRSEFWARVLSLGGYWYIPRTPCSLLVVAPAYAGQTPGSALVITGSADTPPAKLSRDKAYWDLPDDVKLVAKASSHAFKSKHDTVFGVDDATGNFQITFPNGTSYVFRKDGVQFQVAASNEPTTPGVPPTVKTALNVDRSSVGWSIAGGALASWDSAGKFITVGNGPANITHPGGILGLGPVATPLVASAITPFFGPSTLWKFGG